MPRVEDKIDIVDSGYDFIASTATRNRYMIGGNEGSGKEKSEDDIMFSDEIGLAIEKPPNGLSLE